jgi:hypothetical protein
LVLISFDPEKWVGLNILVESVLIFSILVTGPKKSNQWQKYYYFALIPHSLNFNSAIWQVWI